MRPRDGEANAERAISAIPLPRPLVRSDEGATQLQPPDQLAWLTEFQERILLIRDADLVLQLLDRELRVLFPVDFFGAFLVEEETHEFLLHIVNPEGARMLCEEEARLQTEAGVFAWVVQQEDAVVVAPQSPALRAQGQRRLVIAPLVSGSKTLGMVFLLLAPEEAALTQDRLRLVRFLCREAGLAIENARLYEGITRQNEALRGAERELFRSKQQLERHSRHLEKQVHEATTKLEAAYHHLRLETNRLESIIRGMGEGLVVTDRDGRIVVVNLPAERILATEQEALLDADALEAPLPAPLRDALRDLNEAMRGERESLIRRVTFTVGTTSCRATLSPVGRPDNFVGTVILLHDVTQETKIDRAKDQFLSCVTHEMRTPLTSIKLFASLLLDGNVDAAQAKEFFGIILGESERLARLIDDLLDLAKIRSGKITWKRAPARMEEIAHSVAKATYSLAEQKQITIEVEAGPKIPLVMGDTDRLYEVVMNLVSNALKFSPPSTRIRIGVEAVAEGVQTSVIDQGPGIPAEKIEEVFYEFVQLGSAEKNAQKGSGLGLSISREIVAHHGGRIWVESTVGQGSTFRFVLPAAGASTLRAAEKPSTIAEPAPSQR